MYRCARVWLPLRAKGAENALVLILAVLAETMRNEDRLEEGLAALAEAWTTVDRTESVSI